MQLDFFYKAIAEAVERVAKSPLYERDRKGIIVVEGQFVMADAVLLKAAIVSVWLQQDSRTCLKRVLIRGHEWLPADNCTEDEYIDLMLCQDDQRMKIEFDQYDFFEQSQSDMADAVVEVLQKSRTTSSLR